MDRKHDPSFFYTPYVEDTVYSNYRFMRRSTQRDHYRAWEAILEFTPDAFPHENTIRNRYDAEFPPEENPLKNSWR